MKKQIAGLLLAGLFILPALIGCSQISSQISSQIAWSLPKPNFATMPMEKSKGLLVSNFKYIYLGDKLDPIGPNMPKTHVGADIASSLRGRTNLEIWRKVFAGEEVINAINAFPEEQQQEIKTAFNSASIDLSKSESLSVKAVSSTARFPLDSFYSGIANLHPASDFPYASHESLLSLAKKLDASYALVGFVWVGKTSYPAAKEAELVGVLAKQKRKMVGTPVTSNSGGVGFAYKKYNDGSETLMIKAELGVSYKVLEVKSGRTVFANTLKGDYAFSGDATAETPIPPEFKKGGEVEKSQYAMAAWMHTCEEGAGKLIKEIEINWPYIYQLEGEIQAVNPEGITVSLGKADGLRGGKYLAVFSPDDAALSNPIAFFKVKDVQDATCVAPLEKGDISQIQQGMKVIVTHPSLYKDK